MLFGSMYITIRSKKRFDTFCVMFYLLIRDINYTLNQQGDTP